VINGPVTTLTLPNQANQAGGGIDFVHAIPMPLPLTSRAPALPEQSRNAPPLNQIFGPPRGSEGGSGDGKQSPVLLFPPKQVPQNTPAPNGGPPPEFGTSGQPYTTSEATAFLDDTYAHYPFRAAGQLTFKKPNDTRTWYCSASLIKPGVVVTAAHCVANFGQKQFYSNWKFIPAFNNGSAPYGVWTVNQATILTAYYNGTDPCAQSGVICQDDVAVLVLNKQNGRFAGNSAGWFGYFTNGYSYNGSGQALITKLGYPLALDGGLLMQRDDSQGFRASNFSNNTIIGSLMTGGSSGGPWVVNLGLPPSLSGTGFGTAASHNLIVGVTSWGYINTAVKQQGASPFTNGNIIVLVNVACGNGLHPC
jgi:hypothetical protein